ncbi:hypothetical protein NLX67_19705 [Domibacillus sp. A3M-37]|uniref:hypothetical protein n=1 Tax=Domibacillus sp. A3M-37 TaxID=2962037 RepID=UPI0020B80EEC|nr:hypothetical protein [Domibacillus sp. A3M-37]MCP3764570.1 hypothetical protein [Domibacillus sp. A3M-37]
MLDFLALGSLACTVIFLVIAIVSLFKKKGKKALKQFGFMMASFVLFVIFVMNTETGEEPVDATTQEAPAKPEETIHLKFENAAYDKERDIVTVNASTNIVDGTTIGLSITNESTEKMYGGNAPIQEGKVSIEVGEYEFIENGNYNIEASVTVDEANNLEFPKRYGNYQKIRSKVKVENGEIVPSFYNNTEYNIDFLNLGSIEITNAYTKEEVVKKEEEREKQLEVEKKQSAKEIRFAELNKNPEKYSGEFVKYQGEILQIMEDGNSTVIRLAVTKDSFGYDINDVLYITYDGTTPFVDEDVVTVYGNIMGSYTYESQAGYQITLPHIEAEFID